MHAAHCVGTLSLYLRATEHLVLTYSRESPFVRRLIAAGAKPAA
jgi:hypothetical protein